EAVYGQITKFENWDKWSPWKEKDPTAVYSIEGEDGTVGCIQKWKGDPEISGEGQLEITELVENMSLSYDLSFVDWDMTSKGKITLESTETGTKVNWSDEGNIPYIMRPIMLFMDMDDMLGAMFERGLERMDSVALIAQEELDAITYEIQTISFPTSYYLGIRTDEMNISDIDSSLYGGIYGQLAEFCAGSGIRAIGMPVSFGISWDDEKGVCVLMPAFPIEKVENVEMPVESYTVEACKALLIDYYGDYEEMGPAHEQLESYIAAKGYSYSLVMEEFITDPTTVEGPEKVLTKIYYFLK
ncbi:SRPBCC family protein, partial [Crocinitomix catalasitica]|nr:SRPBCC family protein [Crocinitomix catalasitica]